ncbi:hypothetical protein GLOIN_2v1529758, partial [Rhizophagus irregularis DAOM 181602=DAOM 197198]
FFSINQKRQYKIIFLAERDIYKINIMKRTETYQINEKNDLLTSLNIKKLFTCQSPKVPKTEIY